MTYFNELKRSMEWISRQPRTMFIGQAVAGPGTFMYPTLEGVPEKKRLEMPVNESFQMQFTMGLAQAGYIPISVYPRQNFLLLATADMVTLDKLDIPKVIIRVASGPAAPIYPGIQHVGNYKSIFCDLFKSIKVIELMYSEEIFDEYKCAYESPGSKIIIEHGDLYKDNKTLK